MDPETAFWFLSATAQASAALAGLATVAYVFILQRTREDYQTARQWAAGKDRTGRLGVIHVRGMRTVKDLARAAVFFLFAAVNSLSLLALVSPGSPVSLGVTIGMVTAAVFVLAGFVSLTFFLLKPWRYIQDQVSMRDAGPMKVTRVPGPDEPGEKE